MPSTAARWAVEEVTNSTMILFAALPIPYGITKDIVRLQKGVSGARWRPAESLHITVCYFGEVDDDRAEELDRHLASRAVPAIELSLKGVGHFGRNPPHSLWAGVAENPALTGLHEHAKASARRAGIEVERRLYRPHLTMAYLREDVDPARIISFEQRLARWESEPFLVDEMQLWSSHRKKRGPNLYRVEATYPLEGRS